MEHVRFMPWIGSKYESGNRFGKRVLVLGESHYGDSSDANEDFTTFIVHKYGLPIGGGGFFAKVVKVLLQKDATIWLTAEERAETWEHVAFYNYIQAFVGDGARQRPTHEMWLAAERPFMEVVAALRPHLILALGKELERRMPALPAEITVCNIQHPSTGFSYAKWNPRFAEALAMARA